jgi:hypothetical protein
MSGGDPIANIKLLEGPAKNLEHDPEKRAPAVRRRAGKSLGRI